ncbi:MAG: site-specific DNA-methyltransferase [Treponema sp.]|jgi:DNA modification methylase|nr:site-specific DNA-methyltransferase [Treponema sp.]
MGSGTTVFAAQKLRRNSIGIEILKDYCSAVKRSSKEVELFSV